MNIHEYRKVLEVTNIPQELKDKLEACFVKFTEFNEFLVEKENISLEVATMRSDIFLKQRAEELIIDSEIDNMKSVDEVKSYITEKTVIAFKEYLEFEKYDSKLSEELIVSFEFILSFLMSIQE